LERSLSKLVVCSSFEEEELPCPGNVEDEVFVEEKIREEEVGIPHPFHARVVPF